MALAGFCGQCGQNVYLNEQWGCVNGHAWNQVRDWYDPDTGAPVTPYWLQASPAPAADPPVRPDATVPAHAAPAPQDAPADRTALLAVILDTFARHPGYRAAYGTDTDITLDNEVANASWPGGKKKVEYSAILKAVEQEKTIYLWEMLKESGGGLSFGSVQAESYSTFGTKRWGKTSEKIIGPEGVAMDASWDYGATRTTIERLATERGWRVKTVLQRKSAQW